MVIVAIWSSGTIMLVPVTAIGRRSMLRGIDAVVRMQAHRDVARLAGRVDPVADLDAGERHAQRLRRIADRDAQLVGEAAIELDRSSSFGSCSERPTSTAPGILRHLLHEVAGDLHAGVRESGP